MPIELKRLTDKALSISLPENPIKLDTQSVATLIDKISQARAKMKPAVSLAWAGGQKVSAVLKPTWTLETERLSAFVVIHLRNAGFGWTHYALSREQASELAAALQKLAATLPPMPPPSRSN